MMSIATAVINNRKNHNQAIMNETATVTVSVYIFFARKNKR